MEIAERPEKTFSLSGKLFKIENILEPFDFEWFFFLEETMQITVGNRNLEISPKKIYSLPKDIVAKKYAGFLILISPNNGNWIVFGKSIAN